MSKFHFATEGSIRSEMSEIVRLAGGQRPGEPLKRWLPRAARKLGLSQSKAFRLLYQHCRVDAHLADNMRAQRAALLSARAKEAAAELARLERELSELNAAATARKSARANARAGDSVPVGELGECVYGGTN
jgi:hypothetical protein